MVARHWLNLGKLGSVARLGMQRWAAGALILSSSAFAYAQAEPDTADLTEPSAPTSPTPASVLAAPVATPPVGGAPRELTALERAKENERAQALRAEEAEQDRDAIKSGTLMSLGITIGNAVVAQYPVWATRDVRQESVKVVNLPYVQVMPFYWGKPQARREYCAAAWSGGDEDTATNAAMGIARKSGKQKAIAIKTALRAEMGAEAIHMEYLSHLSTLDAFLIITKLRVALAVPPTTESTRAEREAVNQIAQWDWNPTYRDNCFGLQFGAWAGLPADYDARVEMRSVSTQREVKPAFAFGLAFSPHAYFSLLAGLSVANVREGLEEGDEDSGVDRLLWAGSVGLGGNLDLLGGLFR